MGERLVRWLLFSVAIALVPLGLVYIERLTDRNAVTLQDIVSRGELLLIAAALAGSAMGELVVMGRSVRIRKLIAIAGCVITLLASSLYYAHVSSGPVGSPEVVMMTSLCLFGLSLLSSASCIVLAGSRR